MDAMECRDCGAKWFSAAADTLAANSTCPACHGTLLVGDQLDRRESGDEPRSPGQLARLLGSAYEDLMLVPARLGRQR